MKKNKKSLKREIIEWAALIGVGVFLYTTGLYVPVIGTLQRALLGTGLIQPEMSVEADLGTMPYTWHIMDMDGNVVSVENFNGRVLFINFWATWCPPCVAEMPGIQDLFETVHSDSIRFLMISMNQDSSAVKQFINRHHFTFPVYFPADPIPGELQSSVIPTTFVITPTGQIAIQKKGLAKYNTNRFKKFLLSLQ